MTDTPPQPETSPNRDPSNGHFLPGNKLGNRFKPGQSGNPKGRPSAGAAIQEWMNVLQDYTKGQLLAIMKDDDAPATKKTAAISWLNATMQQPDMADFEDYLDGSVTKLESLKKMGSDTRLVKKAKVTTSKTTGERTVEIELRENNSRDMDRIMDRTEGRPHQTSTVTHAVERTAGDLLAEALGDIGVAPDTAPAEEPPAPDLPD